jgi:predicted signal transduction protein with EAL and GGDEF domain
VVEVGASVGIAQCPGDGTSDDALLRCADVAMYRAKRDGRGTFHFFEEGMDAEVREQAALEIDLRRAVLNREIVPHYQPLIALSETKLIGFEILARWQHATRGYVEPELFIPIAEKLGLISELTFTLLRIACRDARAWPRDLVLSLNLSPLQLSDSFLPMHIVEILAETGFPPGRLEIEITESALVRDLDVAKTVLTSFRNLGIKVSLDDFGTGYSSLYHLRELQVDKIKVDRSFVQSMRDNPENEKIVGAILGLTRSLGLPAVAEGIEDDAARRLAIDHGCEFGQGFYFGKAVPAGDAMTLIEEQRKPKIERARRAQS